MSNQGIFDPLLVPAAWFDVTAVPPGWFDPNLVSQTAGGSAIVSGEMNAAGSAATAFTSSTASVVALKDIGFSNALKNKPKPAPLCVMPAQLSGHGLAEVRFAAQVIVEANMIIEGSTLANFDAESRMIEAEIIQLKPKNIRKQLPIEVMLLLAA